MITVIVWLLLIKDNQILLEKRNFGTKLEYGLVGGHVEPNETLKQAAAREAFEEVGVKVDPRQISFQYFIDRRLENEHKIHFFFYTDQWQGTPDNKEPDKHIDIAWHPLDKLPGELAPLAKLAIQSLSNKEIYTEYGW